MNHGMPALPNVCQEAQETYCEAEYGIEDVIRNVFQVSPGNRIPTAEVAKFLKAEGVSDIPFRGLDKIIEKALNEVGGTHVKIERGKSNGQRVLKNLQVRADYRSPRQVVEGPAAKYTMHDEKF